MGDKSRDLMEGGCICGDVMDAAWSSDLICDERSGVGCRWRGRSHERFWSGVWDQL